MEPVPEGASVHKSQEWFQRDFCNRKKLRQVDLSFRVGTKSWSGGNIALDFLVFYVYRSAPCCPGEGGRGAIPYISRIGMCHPKGNGIVPWFHTKMGRQNLYPFSDKNGAKKKILWGGKLLYGLYKGVPPRVFSNPKDEITCKIKQLFWTLGPFIRGKIRRELSV